MPQSLGSFLCLSSFGVPTLCLLLCLALSLVRAWASPKLGVDFQEELLSSSPLVHVPASSLALYRPTQRDGGPETPASPGSLPSSYLPGGYLPLAPCPSPEPGFSCLSSSNWPARPKILACTTSLGRFPRCPHALKLLPNAETTHIRLTH